MKFLLLAALSSVACAQAPLELLVWSWEEGRRDAYTIAESMTQEIDDARGTTTLEWTREYRVEDLVRTVTPDLVTVHRRYDWIVIVVK
ncbi:MAG: hypothetical protein KDA28_15300, partial [Phycisphaerales bacterium]|nr:hypothetical protein [Phycisphaerales bacterium]